MKQKTLTGRLKNVPTAPYRIDWEADFPSDFATEVADFLQPYWRHDVVLAEWPVAGTRMSYDMVNLTRKLVVEVDGRQHDQYVPHFHGSRAGRLAQIKRDEDKDSIAAINGFTMLRIKPADLPLTKEWFLKTFDITL